MDSRGPLIGSVAPPAETTPMRVRSSASFLFCSAWQPGERGRDSFGADAPNDPVCIYARNSRAIDVIERFAVAEPRQGRSNRAATIHEGLEPRSHTSNSSFT